jgi:hypothetical protein
MKRFKITAGAAHGHLNFSAIGNSALACAPAILRRWLPGGQVLGHEYTVRNPRRTDRSVGSFKINIVTGRWADFATGASGGDLISLAAYIFAIGQADAAHRISKMLGGAP